MVKHNSNMMGRKKLFTVLGIAVLLIGSASASITLYNGNFDINGNDLEDGATTIWDASAGNIPSSIVEKAGLDADTLDGYNTSQLTWNVLGIAQTDVSKSDVGLGNVENENALAVDGSDVMFGNLDLNQNNIGNIEKLSYDNSYASGSNLIDLDGCTSVFSCGTNAALALKVGGDDSLYFITNGGGGSGGPYTWEIEGTTGTLQANNYDIDNVGTLNAATKNFVQKINSTHEAVYTSQESPMPRAVIEGEAHIVDSKRIELPEHFSIIVSDSTPMLRAQATPDTLVNVAVTEKTDDYIVIETSGEANVDYRITGIREGYEDKQVVREKE